MLVSITRDCQISGVFYGKWKQLKIDPSLFQSDSMKLISQKQVKETNGKATKKDHSIPSRKKKQHK